MFVQDVFLYLIETRNNLTVQGEFGKWHPGGWGREYRKAFFTV
jgi:hypothetical protein